MNNKYLIEIGVEELPSSYVNNALDSFVENFEKVLEEEKIHYENIDKYATPRRLSIIVNGLADKQEDVFLEIKGPTKKIAYKEDGSINRPLEGFMKSQGATENDLEIRKIKDVEYVFANIHRQGENTKDILSAKLASIIKGIYFPKTMKWGGKNIRFARPIRWVVSLFNEEVLPFEFEGIPVSNTTRGHRFLGQSDIVVPNVDEYQELLRKNYVILDQNERKEEILLQIQRLAKSLGGEIKPDPDLLEELTYIVEYPTAILGNVKEEYLELPAIVITTPMREHLRFSPVYKSDGNLLPYFITIRNGIEEHGDIVSKGNEKVLEARLEDAKFFFRGDREKALEEYVKDLDGIVFQEKLGTMADKTARISVVCQKIGEKLAVGESTLEALKRSSYLSKADLMTNMVQEFTELEGIIGSIYALEDKELPIVSQAIAEQYMPIASGAKLPESTTGTILSIADKLDTLCGLFAIGMIPTGSQDPFGLRRKVIGIIRMIKEKKWILSLNDMIDTSLLSYIDVCGLIFDHEEVKSQIVSFIFGRLENILHEEGIRYDLVDSLSRNAEEDTLGYFQKAKALSDFFSEGDHKMFIEALSRVANIAEKESLIETDISKELLSDAELPLYNSLLEIKANYLKQIGEANYKDALVSLELLTPYIHKYFEDVMILTEDKDLRKNRVKTIQEINELSKIIFDARKIVTLS